MQLASLTTNKGVSEVTDDRRMITNMKVHLSKMSMVSIALLMQYNLILSHGHVWHAMLDKTRSMLS